MAKAGNVVLLLDSGLNRAQGNHRSKNFRESSSRAQRSLSLRQGPRGSSRYSHTRTETSHETQRELSLSSIFCAFTQDWCIAPEHTRRPTSAPASAPAPSPSNPSGPSSPSVPSAPTVSLPHTFYQRFQVGSPTSKRRIRHLKTRSKQGVLGGAAIKKRNLSSTHKIRTKDWTKAVESTYRSKAAILKSTRKLSTFALGEELNDLSGLSIELVFNGLGKDYTVISGAGFDTSFAVKLDIADDELFPNQALGFSMPLPFPPSHVTEIDISSNGWIGLYTKGTRFDDRSEPVEEFLSDNPRLAAYWEDFNPTDADPLTGGLYFDADRTESDGSVFAMVTWNRVSVFGDWNEMTNSNTFQAKLRENGNIVLTWGDMTAERGLVGLSRGLVPPRIDVSELQFGATVSIPFL